MKEPPSPQLKDFFSDNQKQIFKAVHKVSSKVKFELSRNKDFCPEKASINMIFSPVIVSSIPVIYRQRFWNIVGIRKSSFIITTWFFLNHSGLQVLSLNLSNIAQVKKDGEQGHSKQRTDKHFSTWTMDNDFLEGGIYFIILPFIP